MTGSHAKAYGSYLEYIVEWTATARIPTNTSDVAVNVYLSHYAISISGKNISCTVNGTTKSAVSAALSQSNKTKTKSLLASFSFPGVAHANDGSLSCGVSSAWSCGLTYSGTYYASMSVSGTLTGDKIPRASSISSLSTDVEINGKNRLSVIISRAVSTYTHTVKFVFGSKSKTITGVTTGASFVIPMDWLETIPNAAEGIGSCTVTTYSGSSAVGSASKNFTLLCPSFVAPTMDEPAVTRIDNTVPSEWSVYLQNVSGVKLQAVGAAGVYGSTIKAYKITCAGYTADAASLLVNKIPQSGKVTFTVTATDTRGRSVTKTGEITVLPYTSPAVSGLTLFRCDSSGNRLETGTYVSVKADISYTVIGENALTVTCQVMDGGAIYTESLLNSTPKVIGPISTDRAYQIKVSASDLFSSGERYSMISSTRYYMHFKKGGGRGVAFGKAAEHDGVVEIADDMEFWYKDRELLNLIYPVGSIFMSTIKTNPSTYLGGTWVAWGAGRVPVGVDTSQTEFSAPEKTGGEKVHTLTTGEMPTHVHTPTIDGRAIGVNDGSLASWHAQAASNWNTSGILTSTTSAGSGQAHNNLQPYITCYMWKRTA